MDKVCWLCGRNGAEDPLDIHHIFPGADRNKSEKYNAKVYLCHFRCHIFGRDAVHMNGENMRKLQQYGQQKVMNEQGWDIDEFREVFGRNYL